MPWQKNSYHFPTLVPPMQNLLTQHTFRITYVIKGTHNTTAMTEHEIYYIQLIFWDHQGSCTNTTVLDYMKPISQCRPEQACIKQGEPLGRGKGEWGVKRGGGQYTANPGTEWTEIRATTQRRDFQVSDGRVLRNRGRDSRQQKGDVKKGFGSMRFHVYIVLIKDCV